MSTSEYTKVYVEVSSDIYSSIDCDNYYYDTCYINRSETFVDGETEWTTKIFSCLDGQYNNQNPDSVQIRLTFMDLNYYDFFLKSSEDEFMNFMMGTSGNTQQSFGIEGGLGVFGSYVTKEINVPFNHSQ